MRRALEAFAEAWRGVQGALEAGDRAALRRHAGAARRARLRLVRSAERAGRRQDGGVAKPS